jgi:hypothetical protein
MVMIGWCCYVASQWINGKVPGDGSAADRCCEGVKIEIEN